MVSSKMALSIDGHKFKDRIIIVVWPTVEEVDTVIWQKNLRSRCKMSINNHKDIVFPLPERTDILKSPTCSILCEETGDNKNTE